MKRRNRQRKAEPVRHHYSEDAAVTAMHPGPGPDFVFPPRASETTSQRLARLERSFLETSLANALDGHTTRRADAAIIVALRAELGA